MTYVRRHLEPRVLAALGQMPVIIVEGGRATGKSTMCDALIAAHGWSPRLDLTDRDVRERLELDPARFLARRIDQNGPLVIDEAQLVPELLLWVKQAVDRAGARGGPGQFLLTGSARLGRDQLAGTDPLAGRALRLHLWSLTSAEISGRPDQLVERAFGLGWLEDHDQRPTLQRDAGGDPRLGGLPTMPGVLVDSESRPADGWTDAMSAYVDATAQIASAGVRLDTGQLVRTFRYLAAQSGAHLNMARAGSDLAIQAATVRNHLEHLERGFLLHSVPAHRPAEHRIVTAHPKVLAADTGLATWAMRGVSRELTAAETGHLFETRVAHRLASGAAAVSPAPDLRHWRDNRSQREVDFVLCHPDGRFVPIEVKASTSVGPRDTQGIGAFFADASVNAPRGVVVYAGDRLLDLTPPGGIEVIAVPFDLL